MTTVIRQPSTPVLTPEDLLRMPDGDNYELVDGKLVERHVSAESSRVALNIGSFLHAEAMRSGVATTFGADLGYQCFPDLPNHVRKPDASLIRNDRLAALQEDPGYMPIPADLVVEVVSPNDLAYEVAEKVEEYLAAGFRVVWVVHPHLRTVTIYHPGGESSVLHEGDEITGGPALPEFRRRVSEFFAKSGR